MTPLPYVLALPAIVAIAALTPAPVLDASPTPTMVVQVDNCTCESIVFFENGMPDALPWTLSWTPDQGHEDGFCQAASCTEEEPRPCKGSFRIKVSWPQCPTAPCIGVARVSYKAEGSPSFVHMGDLDISHTFIPINQAGGALIVCASKSFGTAPRKEPDDTLSSILLSCPIGNGLTHQRWIKIREACVPCNAIYE